MSAPTSRRDRKRQLTLDQLSDVAWQLFEQHGYQAVTMEQIAAQADVAKGTLYNHFPVKEALLAYRFHQELQQSLPSLLPTLQALPNSRERLLVFFQHSAAWAEQRRIYLPAYLQYRMATGSQQPEQRSGMDRIFAELLAADELRSGISQEVAVHYLSFLYLGALLRWLQQPQADLQQEFALMLDVFCSGVLP